jgi:CheY-like chemotaxis protein
MDGLAGECEQLRATAGALEGERDRLAAEVRGAAAARARLGEALQHALERARAQAREAEPPPDDVTPAPSEGAGEETPEIEGADVGAATTSAAASGSRSPSEGRLVVIDADQAWATDASAGHEVVTIPPSAALAKALGPVLPARLVVNLASPNALGAVAGLRSADFTGRLWGCLADASSGRALPLGTIDVATRPLDPDAVLASLARYAPSGTSVVTVGSDVDAFVSLRQTLARHGISVSMAWTARQAADLLPKLRPDVLMLDLDLPAADSAGIVAHLGACDPVPTLVLIVGSADPAPSFAAALKDPAHSGRSISLGALLSRLAKAPD